MKHTKQDYIKILTRYHAFGDFTDFSILMQMIGDEFKDFHFRTTVLEKSEKLENDINSYYDVDDRDEFFNEKYQAIK